jgi:type II secretory pathway pseudopilin PulG
MGRPFPSQKGCEGFSLLELLTVIMIIFILATLLMGTFGSLRQRAETSNCTANLQNLYAAAASYINDHNGWPQIDPRIGSKQYAKAWIDAFNPYGIGRTNWVCPTQQRALSDPDLSQDKNLRVDYNATMFDNKPHTPYLWPHQPWFVEHAAEHPGGPLLIFANGQVVSLQDALKLTQPSGD